MGMRQGNWNAPTTQTPFEAPRQALVRKGGGPGLHLPRTLPLERCALAGARSAALACALPVPTVIVSSPTPAQFSPGD